jgi:hypothetical protein
MHASLETQLAAWNELKKTRVATFCAHAQSAGARDGSATCP